MGSTDKGVITGFICRLCSKMNRFVIHIYGEKGEKMKLAEKINTYLPITINPTDPLPKTVCIPCIDRLEVHHELMEQFLWARKHLAIASSAESSDETSGSNSTRNCELHLPGCSSSSTPSPASEARPSTSSQVLE